MGDRVAWRSVVACVYQKSTIIPDLSVAENLFINSQAKPGHQINWRELRAQAAELLAAWDLDVDVRTRAGSLYGRGTADRRDRPLAVEGRAVHHPRRADRPARRRRDRAAVRAYPGAAAVRASRSSTSATTCTRSSRLCQDVTVYRDAQAHRHRADRRTAARPTRGGYDGRAGGRGRRSAPTRAARHANRSCGSTHSRLPARVKTSTFEVRPGEIVGLAGAGGSGKFAVANVIVGRAACRQRFGLRCR